MYLAHASFINLHSITMTFGHLAGGYLLEILGAAVAVMAVMFAWKNYGRVGLLDDMRGWDSADRLEWRRQKRIYDANNGFFGDEEKRQRAEVKLMKLESRNIDN